MDVPAGLGWLLLGVAIGALLVAAVVLAGAAARARAARRTGSPEPAPVDDLAEFFQNPPGSRPATPRPDGWTSLVAPPPAPADDRDRAGAPRLGRVVAAVAAVALLGAAATVLLGDRPDGAPVVAEAPATDVGAPSDAVAELRFPGLVLEPRAVGITAAYPELLLTVDGDRPRMQLTLPTWNCLADEAPPDPVAAGCLATLVEHASLPPAELELERSGEELVLRGRAATWIRPAGSPPEPTGRSYDLTLTVDSWDEPTAGAPGRAVAELDLGAGTATTEADLDALRPTG